MVISLYVYDMLVIGNNLEMIHEFKVEMKKVFKIKDLGEMSYFLEMQIYKIHNEEVQYGRLKPMNTPMYQKEKLI